MLIAVGSGSLSAVASMAFFNGTPGALLFVYMATLPIFLVALSMGPVLGMIACTAGLFVAFLMGGIFNACSFGLLHAFPAWIVSKNSLASETDADGVQVWAPVGQVLGLLAMACGAIIILASLYIAGGDNSTQDVVRSHLNEVFSVMALNLGDAGTRSLIDTLVALFPGAMGAAWFMMTIVNALVAQSILAKSDKNIRPTPTFASLTLPHWVVVPMLVAGLVSLLSSGDVHYMAQNLTMIFAIPYFFLGLAVAHWAIGHVKNFRTPLFIGFYVILVASGWALMLVTAMGMLEHWSGIRSRFSQNEHDQSNNLDIDA
ncbi:MAG: DUF2232 domain-containing protein [Rhodospirillales bacterium]|nr:DUF2232 domain-containing protein [Rhodospirillales bacterium]MBT4038912.1 DUF2232 domain-containing protein [Rhodospirillales bacterium]MBT4625247.1 DUF2232 domain-containing protein [Rhodospirillales bacterium]MBT5351010.1 DUF2232 domain-containing protein [Rhodospirillales bacterium]MBT5521270.1 DUF2232 domain-containing protein [Rhodospirillales bacterium]